MFVGNISYGLLNKFKLYVSLRSKKSCEDMYTSYNCGNKSGNYVSNLIISANISECFYPVFYCPFLKIGTLQIDMKKETTNVWTFP